MNEKKQEKKKHLREIQQLKEQVKELHKKEAFLKTQLSHLDSLFENTQDAIAVSNSQHKIIRVNSSFLNLFGYRAEEVVNHSIDSLIALDSEAQTAEDYTREAENKGGLFFEGIRRRKDGCKVSVAVKVTAIEADGQRIGYYGIYRDISRQKYAEEKSEIHEKYFSQLFESAPEAIALSDESLRILKINSEFCRLFKYTEEEVIGKSIEDLIIPEYLKEESLKINQEVRIKERVYAESIRMDKFGKEIYVSILAAAVRLGERRLGEFAIYRDISERKIAEKSLQESYDQMEYRVRERTEELSRAIQELNSEIIERKKTEAEFLKAKEKAEEANRAKTEFLANVSHEIRTPMNAIYGAAGIFENSDLTLEQKKYLKIIRVSTDNLLDLINDVLDLSKIEVGRLELESIPFNLEEVFEKVFEIFYERAQLKNLTFNQSIGRGITGLVIGDPGRIKQILINLLNNAIKFTPEGSVGLVVHCQKQTETEITLSIKVSDTGIGIEKSKQDEIFNSFSQVDTSTTRKYGGTGLGLSIAAKLVEKMGGELFLKSEKGEGTEFYFDLTLKKMMKSSIPQPSENSDPDQAKKILLVEDNAINRKLALYYLKNFGYLAEVAEDGEQALAFLSKNKYDLVLLDIQMPNKDGFAVTREVRDPSSSVLDHQVKIIAMTAHAMKGDKAKCLAAGMDDYISKPIKTQILKEKILRNLKK